MADVFLQQPNAAALFLDRSVFFQVVGSFAFQPLAGAGHSFFCPFRLHLFRGQTILLEIRFLRRRFFDGTGFLGFLFREVLAPGGIGFSLDLFGPRRFGPGPGPGPLPSNISRLSSGADHGERVLYLLFMAAGSPVDRLGAGLESLEAERIPETLLAFCLRQPDLPRTPDRGDGWPGIWKLLGGSFAVFQAGRFWNITPG